MAHLHTDLVFEILIIARNEIIKRIEYYGGLGEKVQLLSHIRGCACFGLVDG